MTIKNKITKDGWVGGCVCAGGGREVFGGGSLKKGSLEAGDATDSSRG